MRSDNGFWKRFLDWVNGDERELWYSAKPARAAEPKHKTAKEMTKAQKDRIFNLIYRTSGVLISVAMLVTLLLVMVNLPIVGEAENPTNNELSQYYIEHGLEDAGATNLVGNMILSYRVFDTFGESSVLFLAATAVTMLLLRDTKNTSDKLLRYFKREDKAESIVNDRLLRTVSRTMLPIIFLYAIYIMVNGHLSPGGGFAGGSILGGGLILFAQEFGTGGVKQFFSQTLFKSVRTVALAGYGLIDLYYAFMGANGLDNHIPLGTPGSLFSSGIILPINVMVGMVVTCTIYAFYGLFHKGEI